MALHANVRGKLVVRACADCQAQLAAGFAKLSVRAGPRPSPGPQLLPPCSTGRGPLIVMKSKPDDSDSWPPSSSTRQRQGTESQPSFTPEPSSSSPQQTNQELQPGQPQVEESSVPVKIALAMLQFYRSGISPMMPSSCRFLPSCSEYSISSYKKFGVWKGTVLTAWRLMRCNPWGGRGYDPAEWPPKGLELVYDRYEYAPHVTVVLGSGLFVYIVHELLAGLFY